ncbi:MAG: hypothetical protein JNL28_17250 [Planctomycetes bacterium]|nr:hypothetical protein [Planctomycetota bacterium]
MKEWRQLQRDELVQLEEKYYALYGSELTRLVDEQISAGLAEEIVDSVDADPEGLARRLAPPGKLAVARKVSTRKETGEAVFRLVVIDPGEHAELEEARRRLDWLTGAVDSAGR